VVALVPAGKSQATKASIYDRGSVLAANAAADLVTRGFLRPAGWVSPPPPGAQFVLFDPRLDSGSKVTPEIPSLVVRSDAAATGTGPAMTEPALLDTVLGGNDDLLYSLDGVADDMPPRASFLGNGARRASDGHYSFIATLQASGSTAALWQPDSEAMLTVVVFHRRDSTNPIVEMQLGSAGWAPAVSLPPDVRLKDLVRPGGAVLWRETSDRFGRFQWLRVLMASEVEASSSGTGQASLSISCEGEDPMSGTLYVFPGAVSFLSKPVRLEGTSEWNR